MLYETLHWDGNQVLFTTSSAGTVDDLKLAGDADILLSGGTASTSFTQRDFSGSTGDPPNAGRELCSDTSPAAISQPGPDGISDGYNIFQGVRNYDPAVGTWSTPDAYEGDVSDPMSQHAYMWNRNNSFLYEDPDGYDPFPASPSGLNKKIWRKIDNPNPARKRAKSDEWFQNKQDKSIVRFDQPHSAMDTVHWHAFRPADPRARSLPGGRALGRPMRDAQGRPQHDFRPGQDSPDFINTPHSYQCACHKDFHFDIEMPEAAPPE